MPSTNSEDDFAQNVALADTPMGLGSVVKAELGGDGDVQFRFLHSAVEFFELAAARFRVIRNNPQTAHLFGCGLDAAWIREPSALAKRIEAARYGVPAAKNEHRIDPFRRKLECGLYKVSAVAVHCSVRSQPPGQRDTVRARRHGQNFRAADFKPAYARTQMRDCPRAIRPENKRKTDASTGIPPIAPIANVRVPSAHTRSVHRDWQCEYLWAAILIDCGRTHSFRHWLPPFGGWTLFSGSYDSEISNLAWLHDVF